MTVREGFDIAVRTLWLLFILFAILMDAVYSQPRSWHGGLSLH